HSDDPPAQGAPRTRTRPPPHHHRPAVRSRPHVRLPARRPAHDRRHGDRGHGCGRPARRPALLGGRPAQTRRRPRTHLVPPVARPRHRSTRPCDDPSRPERSPRGRRPDPPRGRHPRGITSSFGGRRPQRRRQGSGAPGPLLPPGLRTPRNSSRGRRSRVHNRPPLNEPHTRTHAPPHKPTPHANSPSTPLSSPSAPFTERGGAPFEEQA